MTTQDDSFEALGRPEGVLYGFLTNGANITVGAKFSGTTDGVQGFSASAANAGVSGTNTNGGFGVAGFTGNFL
jgi:hypothetical protein